MPLLSYPCIFFGCLHLSATIPPASAVAIAAWWIWFGLICGSVQSPISMIHGCLNTSSTVTLNSGFGSSILRSTGRQALGDKSRIVAGYWATASRICSFSRSIRDGACVCNVEETLSVFEYGFEVGISVILAVSCRVVEEGDAIRWADILEIALMRKGVPAIERPGELHCNAYCEYVLSENWAQDQGNSWK